MPADATTLSRLVEVLGRLAADAHVQVGYLDRLGAGDSADELALELDDVIGLLDELVNEGLIVEMTAAAVRDVDGKLEQFSGAAYHALWTREALQGADVGAQVRRLASTALRLIERARSDDKRARW
jgi:hypothetical protein